MRSQTKMQMTEESKSMAKDELRAWQEISILFSNADDSNESIAKGLKESGYSIDELTRMYEEKISPVLWTVPWFPIPPWYFSRESIEKKLQNQKNLHPRCQHGCARHI
jgi:hypothetical protein